MANDNTTNEDEPLVFTRQLLGVEDMALGFGATSQIREGETVAISLVNAFTIPFDSTRTIGDVLTELLAAQGN